MDKIKKILIVGSKDHKGAECVEWDQHIPYLGDFDLVILNIASISEDFLIRCAEKLETMREELLKAMWSQTELICITAPTEEALGAGNYDWSPIRLTFEGKKGNSFGAALPSTGYLSKLSGWSNFLSGWDESNYAPRFGEQFELKREVHLRNKANDILAFSFKIREYDQYDYTATRLSNSLTFYPPTTKVSVKEGIDLLLKSHIADPEEYKPPEWASIIKMGDEDALLKEVADRENRIKTAKDEIDEFKKRLEYLTQFKLLLTEGGEEPSGERLEGIVEESLLFLGITVNPGTPGKVDRVITNPTNGLSIPVEVGGMKRSITEDKLAQLLKWVTAIEYPSDYSGPRGVLIANPHKDTALTADLTGRPESIDPNNLKRNQEGYGLAILPTIELFKAVKAKMLGEDISSFVESIFSTVGLVSFP